MIHAPFRAATVALSCAAALAVATPASALQPPASGSLTFDVLRDGRPLGYHRLTFTEADGALTVNVDVELKVRIGFITPFYYKHDVAEVWRDGRLESLTATARKDGGDLSVNARALSDDLTINGSGYSGAAPADIVPTTWWNKAIVTRGEALNTETGEILPITVTPMGVETLTIDGAEIEAERYRIEASLTLDVWYDADDRWVKTTFQARGAEVEYVLASAS